MPRIFDNIEQYLLPTLRNALEVAERADFCVGYFNLRGWRKIDDLIEKFQGGDKSCRLLVGMQTLPQEELYESKTLIAVDHGIDNNRVIQFKRQIVEELRKQLTIRTPTNDEEAGLRRLSRQIKAKKVVVVVRTVGSTLGRSPNSDTSSFFSEFLILLEQ